MFKVNSYIYIIDSLNEENGKILKTALNAVSTIKAVLVSPAKGLVEIKSKSDPTDSLHLACSVAKVKLRTRIK